MSVFLAFKIAGDSVANERKKTPDLGLTAVVNPRCLDVRKR